MSGPKVTMRPEHPNGEKYPFNCCGNPNVRWQGARKASSAVCETCGHDWTEALPE